MAVLFSLVQVTLRFDSHLLPFLCILCEIETDSRFYRCFDHRLGINAALVCGLIAKNRRQGFKLIQANALRPVLSSVFVFLTLE